MQVDKYHVGMVTVRGSVNKTDLHRKKHGTTSTKAVFGRYFSYLCVCAIHSRCRVAYRCQMQSAQTLESPSIILQEVSIPPPPLLVCGLGIMGLFCVFPPDVGRWLKMAPRPGFTSQALLFKSVPVILRVFQSGHLLSQHQWRVWPGCARRRENLPTFTKTGEINTLLMLQHTATDVVVRHSHNPCWIWKYYAKHSCLMLI